MAAKTYYEFTMAIRQILFTFNPIVGSWFAFLLQQFAQIMQKYPISVADYKRIIIPFVNGPQDVPMSSIGKKAMDKLVEKAFTVRTNSLLSRQMIFFSSYIHKRIMIIMINLMYTHLFQ